MKREKVIERLQKVLDKKVCLLRVCRVRRLLKLLDGFDKLKRG